jgi:hypothetical protein
VKYWLTATRSHCVWYFQDLKNPSFAKAIKGMRLHLFAFWDAKDYRSVHYLLQCLRLWEFAQTVDCRKSCLFTTWWG